MNNLEQKLFEKLTDLHKVPSGAFNLRKNGQAEARVSTKEIDIVPKQAELTSLSSQMWWEKAFTSPS